MESGAEMNILFINVCVREESRTLGLAKALLERLPGDVTELKLEEELLLPLNGERLALRDRLLAAGEKENALFRFGRQFAAADAIVMAAPYWDLSFPSLLKLYVENISAVGITFDYTPEGIPFGLCRAKELYYVTTAGGPFREDFGFRYIEGLCRQYYGIPICHLIKAEGLDILGNNPAAILRNAAKEITERFHQDLS